MPIIIGNMKSLNLHYDELWFIMRSMDWFYMKKVGDKFPKYSNKEINQANYRLLMQSNVKIISDLAPSQDLFKWYRLKASQDDWNQEMFNYNYAPRFLKEMSTQQDSKDRLNELWSADKEGKTILLVCSCQEESMCHRSIIAGILYGTGVNVTSAFGTDISKYSLYYSAYRKAEKEFNK